MKETHNHGGSAASPGENPRSAPPTIASRGELFVLSIAVALPTVVTWVYFVALNGAPATLQQAAYGVGKTIQFVLPVAWVIGILGERQALRRPSGWSLSAGAALGLVIAAGMAALYLSIRTRTSLFDAPAIAVQAKVQSFGASSPAAYAVLAVFYSVVHSLLEEYYWRWFVFGRLRRIAGVPRAVAISAPAFAAHHVLVLALYFGWVSPFTWAFAGCVAAGGAIWAWLYDKSDSLAATWLSHALVDAAIFGIGYLMIDWSRM